MTVTPGIYRHYKGAYFLVLFTARNATNSGNYEDVVVYVSLDDPHAGNINVRDAIEFLEPIGGQFRFNYIGSVIRRF